MISHRDIADQIWFHMEEKDKIIKLTKLIEHSELTEYCAHLKEIFDVKKDILDLKNEKTLTDKTN